MVLPGFFCAPRPAAQRLRRSGRERLPAGRPCLLPAMRGAAPGPGSAPAWLLCPGRTGGDAGEYFLCDGFLTPGKNVLPIGKKTRLGESIMAVEYKDYYKLLGVERSAGADEIARAYKKLART